MELELRFFATFREAVGQKERSKPIDDGTTVGDVLADLEAEYDGLEGQLLENGAIRPQLSVLKNGRDVVHMAGVDTDLEDGDRLSVFPPVAGGAGAVAAPTHDR
ncbi:ubiquitin-like small modifier protein 1 [Natronosalvus vescus]|uniref:ubiquitin-like small modifier protein 1 n=1 Tax=Natronosalvus vescus TaxID=2953881 RepID=UPI0020917E6C|nr:ubiquitin-like small modifier protein 1 [Natronosalvus vescus]